MVPEDDPGVTKTMRVSGYMSVTSGRFGSVRSPGPVTLTSRSMYSCTLYWSASIRIDSSYGIQSFSVSNISTVATVFEEDIVL